MGIGQIDIERPWYDLPGAHDQATKFATCRRDSANRRPIDSGYANASKSLLGEVTSAWHAFVRRRRVSGSRGERIAEFARQFALLLSKGVALVEAIEVLIRQQRGALSAVLRDVREKVTAGMRLSDALARHPQWFEEVFCTAVRVGQMSGHMDVSLRELAVYLRERQLNRGRVNTTTPTFARLESEHTVFQAGLPAFCRRSRRSGQAFYAWLTVVCNVIKDSPF